jgi:hypothetical protein
MAHLERGRDFARRCVRVDVQRVAAVAIDGDCRHDRDEVRGYERLEQRRVDLHRSAAMSQAVHLWILLDCCAHAAQSAAVDTACVH